MTRYVVDASVAVKWFLPEPLSLAAEELLDEADELIAPDLLLVEFANVLWKTVRRGEMSKERAAQVLSSLKSFPIQIFASGAFIELALDIANATGRTVYDSLYLALATMEQCQLVTADRRLHSALRGGYLEAHSLWLEDVRRLKTPDDDT